MAGKLSASDIQMQITETGIEEQIRALENMPESMRKYLKTAVRKGNELMKKDELPMVKQFTGGTYNSIKSTVKMGTLTGSVTGITGPTKKYLFYFRMMQSGRAVGAKAPPSGETGSIRGETLWSERQRGGASRLQPGAQHQE